MVQTETRDAPTPSATSAPSPPQSQTSILPTTDATPHSAKPNLTQQPSTALPSRDALVQLDDEVQFIFSAPRRRKKRRRRIESSRIVTEDFRASKASTDDPQPSATSPGRPRRGTTGMVQRLEFCHLGESKGISGPRSESLPLVPPTNNTSSTPRSSLFTSLNQHKPSSQFLPFAPFMSMPLRTNLRSQLSVIPMASNDRAPTQTGDEVSQKRKYERGPDRTGSRPKQRSQPEQPPFPASAISEVGSMDFEPLAVFGNSGMTTASNDMAAPIPTMQNFSWNPYSNMNRSPSPFPTSTPAAAKSSVASLSAPTSSPSKQHSIQNLGPMQTLQSSVPHKQTVTVPARLVPEQSVSPRTQTVEIPRLPYSNQIQTQQMMLLQRAMNANGQPVSSLHPAAMSRNSQFQIPRSVPLQALFPVGPQRSQQNQLLNRPQNPQIYPSDVVRKPSLYKIPPWPSTASSARVNQVQSSAVRPPTPNASVANLMLAMNGGLNSGNSGISDLQRQNMIHARNVAPQGIHNGFHAQGMMPVTPPRTPPPQSHTQSSPPTSPSTLIQSQENPNKRKHSPNLIVDIAETCQSNFPFAAVAERHQTPIQKVFDTFSAIIQLPLLRSASDNRRHGSLGKRRMKEFGDAKKAMEKEIKEKAGGPSPRRGRKPAKKGPEQPLLRAAILNNASRGKDVGL